VAIVEARDLTRIYRLGEERVTGVREASLTIEAGEFAVLAGPSGSGKTTLLNLLGLLDTPDSGRLVFEGRDASALDERSRARVRRERVGFVFQAHQLVPVLTAEENVALALWIRDLPEEECRSRARAALAAAGLAGLEDRRPDALSGGQRQRVAVARALVNQPSILLADEPTGNLDSTTGEEIMGLFGDLHKTGQTIIVVTHEADIAARARRQVHIFDGRIARDIATAAAS